jgi:hypothetical protein
MGHTRIHEFAAGRPGHLEPEQLLTTVWTLEEENARLRQRIAVLEGDAGDLSDFADEPERVLPLDDDLETDELPRDGAWLRAGFSVAAIGVLAVLIMALAASFAAGDSGLTITPRLRDPLSSSAESASSTAHTLVTRTQTPHPRYGRGLLP